MNAPSDKHLFANFMFFMKNLIWIDLHQQTAQASMINQMMYAYVLNE